ncbi:MAG TPA: hypothetical protein VLE96_01155 [Chlamydiales bacterium]|nr:hypothetical protein [Chlamydiales bacterium]
MGSCLQSFLAMDYIRHPVNSAGRCLACKTIHVFSSKNQEIEESSCGELQSIPKFEAPELTSRNTMIATAGICAQILFYGAFYAAVCSTFGPVEHWQTVAVIFGPWWSSSYWMDWLIYDFIRSSYPFEEVKSIQPVVSFLDKWFPHNNNAEFREGANSQKICYFLCAVAIFVTYALVCMHRPAASQIILNRAASYMKSSDVFSGLEYSSPEDFFNF